MFKNIILIIIAMIPVIILLKFVFEKDKIEKEPHQLLLKLFIAGILSTLISLLLSRTLSSIININNNFFKSFIKVAFIEELSKWGFI